MGLIVVTCFRPKEGKEAELLAAVHDHLSVLRAEGLATDREAINMRSSDGTIIEVFEWVSEEAVTKAHSNPEVQKLWKRYEEAADLVHFSGLAEALGPWPSFPAID